MAQPGRGRWALLLHPPPAHGTNTAHTGLKANKLPGSAICHTSLLPTEPERDSLQIWHSAVFVPWGDVPGQPEASVLLLVMFLLACHMFDKNKFNLIHFELFFFTVPSYFKSVSIMEGFPYKQDSSFSRDCTIATFLLYWAQKGIIFLKWELQDVIYIVLFLSVHHSRLWYICGYSRRLFGLVSGFGCKVMYPFHLTWCGFSILQF